MMGRGCVALPLLVFWGLACGSGAVHEERLELSAPADELAVEFGSGDMTVVGADVATVKVVARVQGETNHLGSRVEGKRVSLFSECNEHPCGLDVVATVPSPLLLVLKTGSGDISARDLTGASISAHSGSGDIEVRTAMPVEHLSVKTGSGDVDVAVPQGTYKLAVATGSGDQRIEGVSHDPAAVASIAIDTGSGDVALHGR